MQTVKTIPGRTYAVESAGEVIVTNTETGAIATQGDGYKQVWFTACANSYDVSDDTAKVVALFKLAPRLRLTLLQGVAGGLLPRGFTELEYLESSGTQYIDTGIVTDGTYTISARMQLFASGRDVWGRRSNNGNAEGNELPYGNSVFSTYSDTTLVLNYVWRGYNRNSPFDIKQIHDYVVVEGQKTFMAEGVSIPLSALNTWTVKANNLDGISHFLFWSNATNGASRSGKANASIYSFRMQDGAGNVVLDFVPVLRNADGVAGMWDKVSKQFFENIGTGSFGYRIKRTGVTVAPMSLRDPYYTAPSGVYARVNGKNALDIVADTEETTGEGWEWFSNTSEAYEYFGIVSEEELLTE